MKNIKIFLILIVLVGLFSFSSSVEAQPCNENNQDGCDTRIATPKEKADIDAAKKPAAPINKSKPPVTTRIKCPDSGDASTGLIRCGREFVCDETTYTDASGKETKSIVKIVNPDKMCDFDDLIDTVNRIITFMLLLALPIVAMLLAWAGGLLLFSGGSTSKRDEAKKIFFNAIIGLLIAFLAFLIVKTILIALGYSGGWIGFK